MRNLLKDLFAGRGAAGRCGELPSAGLLERFRADRPSFRKRDRRLQHETAAPAEQLEPRLALTVGYFTVPGIPGTPGDPNANPPVPAVPGSPGTVYVHVDNTEGASHAFIKGTETGDLLVSDNAGFFNAGVVPDIANLQNMLVFSGSARFDEVLDPLEWWVLSGGNGVEDAITGLQLTGDGQMYAYGLIEGDTSGGGENINLQPFPDRNPGSRFAEVFGTISYTQSDGTVSRWYFSNYNPDTGRFDAQRVIVTAGPGVAAQGDAVVNQANQNNPDLFVPVTDLVEGYNYPVAVRIVQGEAQWDRRLEVQWNAKPAEAPIITATYPVTTPTYTDTEAANNITRRVLNYNTIRQITRSGALSRPDLGYRLAGAYSTGFGDDAASVGRLPGFLTTRLDIATTHRSWDPDDQTALANGADGVVKRGGSVAVGVSASLDDASLQEQFDKDVATISPLGGITVDANFNAEKRDADWSLQTDVVYRTAGDATLDRNYSFPGINVHRGAAPQMLDTEYLTWTKDGAAEVTFAPGPNLAFDDITVELTSPGSTVNIDSPISAKVLDIRATNVIVNAETAVGGELYVGRSTQLKNEDDTDRPRLTLSSDYGDTPVMKPENWVVEGVEPIFAPVFGPNGSIARLEVPAGGEGYGYDPNASPVISVTPPAPQQAVVEVIGVSGSLSSVSVQAKGSGLENGFYPLTANGNQTYAMVQKISIGGVYDFFDGGPVVADAIPLIVVDKPTLATNEDRIGYGEAATAVAGWTSGVTKVQASPATRTITYTKDDPTPPNSIQAGFTIDAGDTGLIRQPATLNDQTIIGKVVVNQQGGGGTATYSFPGGTLDTATFGAGYDPERTYGGQVSLGGGVTAAVTPIEFREGLLSVSVTDGGLNYDPDESVGVNVITQLDAAGVSELTGYVPSLSASLAPGSSFFGDEITVTAVTSGQTQDRNLFEYLKVGMPLRGPGLSPEATVAGVDYTAGVISVSPGGIVASALLGDANFYPHEFYVENQPSAEDVQGLVAVVTLAQDFAQLEAQVVDGQLLALSILDPVDDPFDGEFPGRRGGSGYQVIPDLLNTLSIGIPRGAGGASPAVVGTISGEIAEAEVRLPGSNYLANEPNREGILDVEVFGGVADGLLQVEVVGGRLSGRGQIADRGAGYQSAGVAIENVPEPDDFLPGQGEAAEFRAVVEPDGTIRETIRIRGGSEYVVTPTVFIEAPLTISEARATADVDLLNEQVISVDVQVAGSGYTQPPAVTIAPPGPDGVGRRALAVATIESGKIKQIRIVDPGSGYTSQPEVTIASPFDPAVVETMRVNADLRVEAAAELYIGDEASTTDPRRGLLAVASETTLGSDTLGEIYVEARASDITNQGTIQTGAAGRAQVQLVSTAAEQFGGPFRFSSEGAASLQADRLVIGLENQSEVSADGSYRHEINLGTKVNTLRVATTVDANTGNAAPYSLAITELGDLDVDAVLRAGGDISLSAGGDLNIKSSVLTDAGVLIRAKSFTVASPVVSQQGPIRIETDNALNVLNGLTVASPQRDPNVNDIELIGRDGVEVRGEVTALNGIRLAADNGGVNVGLAVTDTSLISTAGALTVDSRGDVSVRTAVTEADIRAPGSVVTLVEADDISIDVEASRVNLVAMGVDPGVYGANANALEGILRDVEFASVSAPQGSIYLTSDIATRFELDRSLDEDINDQERGLEAAGNVEITALAAEVLVKDAPLAGGAARVVRFAVNGELPRGDEYGDEYDVEYDPGQAGVTVGRLEGKGKITAEKGPFRGHDGELKQGDLVLVKDEVQEPQRNGIYAVERMGGGEDGFENWLLVRADDASSEASLPSGTFVQVREGEAQGYYQIQYAASRQQIVEVSRRSQLEVNQETLYGLEPGVRVSGAGVVPTAEVSGIDWTNRVVTLGLPAGVTVRPLTAAAVRSSFGPEALRQILGDKYIASGNYVGLELSADAGSQQFGADHPLVQAVNAARAAKSPTDRTVRISSRGDELAAFAEAYGGRGNILVLSDEDVSKGSDWEKTVADGAGFTIYPGFVTQASDGRTLNPAARSQLLTVPIASIDGNKITVDDSFFRWDVVIPGQQLSGDGLEESARVVSVSPATRTIVLSEDSLPANFPQQVALATSSSPNSVEFDEYEQIFLDGEAVTADVLRQIQPGMLVTGSGLAANTVVAAVGVDRGVLAVAAGSIDSWGTAEATTLTQLNVVDTETGQLLLGSDGARVTGVIQANGDLRFTDSLVLEVNSNFNDLDFARLRVGMTVSGQGIREGAKLLSIDVANRTVGITPGSIVGQVVSLQFHNPVYDIATELESGRLSLAADGGKTLTQLRNEGRIPTTLTATVAGARASMQDVGTFSDELYRVIQSSVDAASLPNLVQEARTRFLDDSGNRDWQQNVVLGQEVVTDLVRFDALSLGLAEGEEIKDLTIIDRTTQLAGVPAYLRAGTGTRVVAVVESEGRLVVRRWEHVGATDEFVTQAVSSEIELEGWVVDGIVKAVATGNDLLVAYQTDASGENWREVTVSGLQTTLNLFRFADVPKPGVAATAVVFAGGVAYYPAPPSGPEFGPVTAAAHISGTDFLVAYKHVTDGFERIVTEWVVKKWDSSTGAYGSDEKLRTPDTVEAIAVAPVDNQAVVVAVNATSNDGTATFIDLSGTATQAVELGNGLPGDVRYSADGTAVAIGLGANGVAIITEADSAVPQRAITYNLAEEVGEIVDSPLVGAWGGLAFVDRTGAVVTLQELDAFDRSLDRSRVVGVDYRTGILSITGDAVGLGDDLAIQPVGDLRYAVAPAATLSFLTEAQLEPRAVRYDDGDGQVDTGDLHEVTAGRFNDGYVVVDDPVGAAPGDTTNSATSLWQVLADQLSGVPGGYVYAKNSQGQWVYFARLTGVESYSRTLGLESISSDAEPLAQLRNITVGTSEVKLMVAATHSPGTDYRELPDGSQIRLNQVWPDDLAERREERWQGDEIFLTVRSQRSSDDGRATPMFIGTQSSDALPVTLASQFMSGAMIRPGMQVTGDGINAGTFVEAVDLGNNIVWLNQPRDLTSVGDAVANRFLQFSYSLDRPNGSVVVQRAGTIAATGLQSAQQSDFDAVRLVSNVLDIQTTSQGDGVESQLKRISIGATVLENFEGAIAGGGAVTGVDWRIGLVGVSDGTVLDSQRLETPGTHLVEFQDRNGTQKLTLSVDVESASAGLSGRRGGLAITVGGRDGGAGTQWPALALGGDVYLELVDADQAGDRRDLVRIGVLQGYDSQLGQIYLRNQTEAASQLLSYQSETPPRLLLLDAGLSFDVASGLVPLAYTATDPNYLQVERESGRPVQLMRVGELASSYSEDAAVTRLGVSSEEDRSAVANWLLFDPARNASSSVGGVPLAGSELTLAEMARLSGRSLTGAGVAAGSSITAVGLSAEGLFVDSNFGVSDGDSAGTVVVSSPLRYQNETAGLISGSYTQNGQNGDLISVSGYKYLDHLVAAFEPGAISISAVGDQDSETGTWLKADSRVIGIDSENSVLVIEPGAVLTNSTTNIRFFIDGERAEVSRRTYLDSAGGLPAGEYLPDAAVGSAMPGVDASGMFTGSDIVAVVLQRDGVEIGTFDQRRFSSFHRLGVDGNTQMYRVSAAGQLDYLGDVVGVDAENMLVAIQTVDAQAAAQIRDSLIAGVEIRFQVNGVWLEGMVGDEAIKPAIVKSSSSVGDWTDDSLFTSEASKFVTRLTVTDLAFDLSRLSLGDVVTDDLGLVAQPVTTSTGGVEAVRVVGVDPVNRIFAIAWTGADGAIVERMPALVESLGLATVSVAAGTPQAVSEPVVFEVGVSGGRRQAAGVLSGDLLRLPSEEFALGEHQIGRQLAPVPGSVFGAGGQILGSTGAFGLISVTPGTAVARVSGPVQSYDVKAVVDAWSEGDFRSATLPGAAEGSLFTESRGIIDRNFRAGQLTRVNLGARAFVSGEYAGRVTGLDPSLGLLGIAAEDAAAVAADDVVDVELSELLQRGDYRISRESVVGTFVGTRLLAQASGFSNLAGNPIDPAVVEIGMPVWTDNDALIAYVSGVAPVTSAIYGDAVLLGLTANAAGPDAAGSMIPGDVSLIDNAERLRFGGQLSAAEGRVIDAVAELGMLDGRMAVETSGDLAATAPAAFLFHGLSGPRVTVVGPFPNAIDLLGASVVGSGVPVDTIITGFDEQLGLIGLSNPVAIGSGSVSVEITPVESLTPVTVTVGDAATEFVGDLNGDARLILSDSVVLPLNAEPWVGRRMSLELSTGQSGTADILGIDLGSRLVAFDWVNQPANLPAGVTVTAVTIDRGAVIGHSGSAAPGSDLDLGNKTTLFVDPNSLSYLQTSVGSREFAASATGQAITIRDDGSLLIAAEMVISAAGLAPWTVIDSVQSAANGTQVTLRNYWTGLPVSPPSGLESVLISPFKQHEVAVGDSLALSGRDGAFNRFTVRGIDRTLGLVVVDDLPREQDRRSAGWLLDGENSAIRAVAVAPLTSYAGPLPAADDTGVEHAFEFARFRLSEGVNFNEFFLGQEIMGTGLSTNDTLLVTGVDAANRLLGVKAAGGSVSTLSKEFSQTVVDSSSAGSLTALFSNLGRFVPASSARAATPGLDGSSGQPTAFLDIGNQFPFAWLHAAVQEVSAFRADPVQAARQAIQIEGRDADNRLAFSLSHDLTDNGLVSYDPRLGVLQLNDAGYDLTDVTTVRISVERPVNLHGVNFAAEDLSFEVGLRSFSVDQPASPTSAGTAHRIYIDSSSVIDLSDQLGASGTVAGPGIRGTQPITSFGTDLQGAFLTVSAGGIDAAGGPNTGTRLELLPASYGTSVDPLVVSVRGVRNYVVGQISRDVVRVDDASENSWQNIVLGGTVSGSGLSGFGGVLGYDPANKLLYLEAGATASAEPLSAGVAEVALQLDAYRSAPIGTTAGDTVVLRSGSAIDLNTIQIGDRVRGDGIVSNTRVVGISPTTGTISLTAGGVESTALAGTVTVVRTGVPLDVDTNQTSRARGAERTGVVVRLVTGFEQYDRIYVGQTVAGPGLSGVARVEAIDAVNRLLFLNSEAVTALGEIDVLRFSDSDGEVMAFVSKLADGTPQVTFGLGQPGSTIVGRIEGDLLVVPESDFGLFRDYGNALLGTEVVGGVVPAAVPVLGYDTVTGIIALPIGAVQLTANALPAADSVLGVAEGLSASAWGYTEPSQTKAMLSFEDVGLVTAALLAARPGQIVGGIGINPSAVVDWVDPIARELLIKSRNGKPVIDLDARVSPRQITFGVPTTVELGATTTAGSSRVTFEFDDFGRMDMQIGRRSLGTAREVGPAVDDDTQLVSRSTDTNRKRETWAVFSDAEKDQVLQGPGVRGGSYIYRPVYGAAGVSLQAYHGTIYQAAKKKNDGDYRIVGDALPDLENKQWYIEARAVSAVVDGALVRVLGTKIGDTETEGETEGITLDWVGDSVILGLTAKTDSLDHSEQTLSIKFSAEETDLSRLDELALGLGSLQRLDVVIGSPFEDGLRADSQAFTAVNLLASDIQDADSLREIQRRKDVSLRSAISTSNAQGTTRFIVGGGSGNAESVNNLTSRSLGKMVSVWKATASAGLVGLADPNPAFSFQFDSTLSAPIVLGQELPTLNVPIMVDGQNRFGATNGSPVVIDGSRIALNEFGQPVKSDTDEGVYGIVFEGLDQDDIKKQAGVRGLNFVGFGDGAAVRLSSAENVLVAENVFGVDGNGARRSNRQGVRIDGNSQFNAILNNQFAGSNDTAIIVTDSAKSNFIVGNTIGIENVGNNHIGVHLEADENFLGVPADGFSDVVAGQVFLTKKQSGDPIGERVIQFQNADVDLSGVTVGMRVILESYPRIIHEVVGVDLAGKRLTIKEQQPVLSKVTSAPASGDDVTFVDITGIGIGWVVEGEGVPNGTTVTAVSQEDKQLTLSKEISVRENDELRFSPQPVLSKVTSAPASGDDVTFVDITGIGIGWVVEGEEVPDGTTVTAVSQEDKQLTLSKEISVRENEELRFSPPSQVNDSLQQMTATLGYQVRGDYNENTVTMTAKTYNMVKGRLFVGQTVSGPDIPAGTTVIGIGEGQDEAKIITLSNRLLGFGYDIFEGGPPASATRLIAFGNESPNVISQSTTGVLLGVGWEHTQLSVFDGFLTLLEDPDVPGRTFTGWQIIGSQSNLAAKFYAVFSTKVLRNGEIVDGDVFRVPVKNEGINEAASRLEFEDVFTTPTLQKWDGTAWTWRPLLTSDVLQELSSIEAVSVTFMAEDQEGNELLSSGSRVVGTEIVRSYEGAIKILDSQPHVIGDARASTGLAVSREAGDGTSIELSSWAIEVEVPPSGGNEIEISEPQLEVLRRMLQDWKRVERDTTDDPKANEENPLEFASHEIKVYGYGVKDGVTIDKVEQIGGQWRLTLKSSGTPFIDDLTGTTTLSFGVGWYVDKDEACKGLRVGDAVMSERQGREDRVPGRHLPEFTEVREVGTAFVRVSTPLYGQRIEGTSNSYRGVEGFQEKVGSDVTVPRPISFINSRFGNVIADNEGPGVEMLKAAGAASAWRLGEIPADGVVKPALAGNVFGLLSSTDDGLVVAQNRGGSLNDQVFKVLYGIDAPANGTVPLRDYVNDWDKRDRFGNIFAEEDMTFVIELPSAGLGSGDRPTFWYL